MPEGEIPSERAAFDRLYEEQGSLVRGFLRFWLRNSAAADDLTQETFLHFWQKRSAFDPDRGAIRTYLFGIARKKAMDWHRRQRQSTELTDQPDSRSTGLLINDALNQLPEDLRMILWLREVEGYSYDELARLLKIPIGSVRSRLHGARKQLRMIWLKEA
jgi:RNA polymerase sigma factor (sigma-70 family)